MPGYTPFPPETVVAALGVDRTLAFKAEVIEFYPKTHRYRLKILTAGFADEWIELPRARVIVWPKHDLFKGNRVGTHPATDDWMSGDRYGNIVSTGPLSAIVKLDSGRIKRFTYYNLINPDTKKPYEEV